MRPIPDGPIVFRVLEIVEDLDGTSDHEKAWKARGKAVQKKAQAHDSIPAPVIFEYELLMAGPDGATESLEDFSPKELATGLLDRAGAASNTSFIVSTGART